MKRDDTDSRRQGSSLWVAQKMNLLTGFFFFFGFGKNRSRSRRGKKAAVSPHQYIRRQAGERRHVREENFGARAWVSRPALIHRRVRSTMQVSETKNKSKMWKAVRRFSPLRAGSALCRSGAPCHHSAHQLEPGQETVWVTTLGGEWSNVDVN